MPRRGVAGVTHCGKWRPIYDDERSEFGLWFVRLCCNAPPHDEGAPHRNKWARVSWVGPYGELRREGDEG